MDFTTWCLQYNCPGAMAVMDKIYFSISTSARDVALRIYDNKTGKILLERPFLSSERVGNRYVCSIAGYSPCDISYSYLIDKEEKSDERALAFAGKTVFGQGHANPCERALVVASDFDWDDDKRPGLKFEDSIFYQCHVRGFTKSNTSQVKNKGSFLGMLEKLDYLSDLGVSTLELQPVYEFDECGKSFAKKNALMVSDNKLNYWGYVRGYYYAVKRAYCAGEDSVEEFSTLVRELHKRNMEIILQFYFDPDMPHSEILSILRYWRVQFHIDGFHLMGSNIPMELLYRDDVLADSKLINDHIDFIGDEDKNLNRRLMLSNDDFLYTMRKLLKGDEGMVGSAYDAMRRNPDNFGIANYISSYRGFTLNDLVSYERKHNEENGEDNRDGNDYNCSWNCGEEGPTRKRKIKDLRIKQMKNALALVILSGATPLLFMGDEFGNSQKGNNNPYCIDSQVTWLDWKDLSKNKEIYDFCKLLIDIRKKHGILHASQELPLVDIKGQGFPAISYHSETAWRASTDSYSRLACILYNCDYVSKMQGEAAQNLMYVAMNFHWEDKTVGLPKPPKGYEWKLIANTAGNNEVKTSEALTVDEKDHVDVRLKGRSVSIYETVASLKATKNVSKSVGSKAAETKTKDRTNGK